MDDARGFVKFERPANYDSIIQYAEASKKNFADIRKYRPKNIAIVKQALNDYLRYCLFENCIPNSGYIKALGFIDRNLANQDKKLQSGNGATSK
jgi:hypothetical protein